MSINKKLVVAFLTAINIMNLAAGVITQIKIITGSDVTSIIPIRAEMTVNQILLLNLNIQWILLVKHLYAYYHLYF